MRRREFFGLVGGAAAAWTLPARGQQKTMPVIGFLSPASADAVVPHKAGFTLGLGEAGYVVGQNLAIEYRWADDAYDRLPALAADLVGRKVDVIVAQAPAAARAAKNATTTIPVVFGVGADPVAEGLVASLARPGGNLTGVSLLSVDLAAKRLDLLSELAPGARHFALLVNPNNPNAWIGGLQDRASVKRWQVLILKAASEAEIDAAFAAIVRHQVQALVIGDDPFLSNKRAQIIQLALRHRIPAIAQYRSFPDDGGLVSYGSSLKEGYRQIGLVTAKILRGAKPADLAVQQPTKFEMVINRKTAKALGLTIPPLVLAQADEVID